jgi:hypothetical protein
MLGERDRAESMGAVRIDAFEELPEGTDPDQLAALLAEGEAIYAVLKFHGSGWDGNEVKRTGYLPHYPAEAATEAHAVTLEGYRWGPWGREFLFKNSWGQDWGRDGRAWIPQSMLSTHMTWGYRVRATLTNAPSAGTEGPKPQAGLCVPGLLCLPRPEALTQPGTPWPTLQLPMGLPIPRL